MEQIIEDHSHTLIEFGLQNNVDSQSDPEASENLYESSEDYKEEELLIEEQEEQEQLGGQFEEEKFHETESKEEKQLEKEFKEEEMIQKDL